MTQKSAAPSARLTLATGAVHDSNQQQCFTRYWSIDLCRNISGLFYKKARVTSYSCASH